MRVVLYEPDPGGHRLAYLAHVVPVLAELGCTPILLTTRWAADSPEFATHLAPHAEQLIVDTSAIYVAKPRTLGRLWKQWADLVRAVRALQPDHLYVAYGDGLVQVAGLERMLGRRPWPKRTEAEVLLLRGGYSYGAANLQTRLRARCSPGVIRWGPWERIYHLNPDDVAVLRSVGKNMAARCRLMPDPIQTPDVVSKSAARRLLGVPEAGRYLGCVGLIDTRKGIDLLLAAFRQAQPRLYDNDRLLLAGPVAPEIRSLLQGELAELVRQQRVVVVDRQLSGAEMNQAVAALDVVCTPYPTHVHSASIVIRAAAARRPVLGSAVGWMDRTICRFRLGSVCDVTDREGFARALARNLDQAEQYLPGEAAQRFAAFHSGSNFAAHWTARIRERLGLPPQERVEWEWVMAALDEEVG